MNSMFLGTEIKWIHSTEDDIMQGGNIF